MMKLAMSPATASLLRAILNRAGVDRTRVLLSNFRSVDWQSLTFVGERHEIDLRIAAPGAPDVAERILAGIREAEFAIPGHVVADIQPTQAPIMHRDGSIGLAIEALTIAG